MISTALLVSTFLFLFFCSIRSSAADGQQMLTTMIEVIFKKWPFRANVHLRSDHSVQMSIGWARPKQKTKKHFFGARSWSVEMRKKSGDDIHGTICLWNIFTFINNSAFHNVHSQFVWSLKAPWNCGKKSLKIDYYPTISESWSIKMSWCQNANIKC